MLCELWDWEDSGFSWPWVCLCINQDVFSGGAALPGAGLRGTQRVWGPRTCLLGASGQSGPHAFPRPGLLLPPRERLTGFQGRLSCPAHGTEEPPRCSLSGRRAEEGAGGRGFSEPERETGPPGAGPPRLLQRGLQGGLGGGASGVPGACACSAGSAGTQAERGARSALAAPRLACPRAAAECPLSTHWPGWRVTARGRSGPQPKCALRLRFSGQGN